MIKIKILKAQDAESILELESRCGLKLPSYIPYDRKQLDIYIFNNKDAKAFGAYDKDELIGWSGYSCMEKEDGTDRGVYEMCGMVVDPRYRRQGIGLKLFKVRLEELLKKKNLKRIYATNFPKNSPIIILYLTNGFVIYDYKKDIYGPGADRIFVKYEAIETVDK